MKSVENMAISFLRKVYASAAKGTVAEVYGGLPLEVAYYLLNRKKRELVRIEADYEIAVTIKGKPSFLMNQLELELVRREKPLHLETAIEETAEPATEKVESSLVADETRDHAPPPPEGAEAKKKKRRRKKKVKSDMEAPAEAESQSAGQEHKNSEETPVAEHDETVPAGDGDADTEHDAGTELQGGEHKKKRRRRRRRSKTGPTEGGTATDAPDDHDDHDATGPDTAVVEEAVPAAAEPEVAVPEPPVEEAPKKPQRKRAPRKKKSDAEVPVEAAPDATD